MINPSPLLINYGQICSFFNQNYSQERIQRRKKHTPADDMRAWMIWLLIWYKTLLGKSCKILISDTEQNHRETVKCIERLSDQQLKLKNNPAWKFVKTVLSKESENVSLIGHTSKFTERYYLNINYF